MSVTNEQTPRTSGPDEVGAPAPAAAAPRRSGTVARGTRGRDDAPVEPASTEVTKDAKSAKATKPAKAKASDGEAKPAKAAKTPKEPAADTADKPAKAPKTPKAPKAAKPKAPAAPPADEGAAADAVATDVDAPADSSTQGAGGLRVVVAEDEALIRLDLAEMLQDAGYEVVGQAPDGEQAIELVREHRPDLVVLDVKMPVLDGISAAEAIGKERIAPVVMLTAFSDKDLVERARDAGVMAYVVKPFTIDDLRPALDIARSRWTELTALESEIADLGERLETRKAVDRAKGVLMTQLKLSEADAFRWIQKTAMDRRLGMREVAEAVITGLPSKR